MDYLFTKTGIIWELFMALRRLFVLGIAFFLGRGVLFLHKIRAFVNSPGAVQKVLFFMRSSSFEITSLALKNVQNFC